MGCDHLLALPCCGLFHVFQSTHPSGVRLDLFEAMCHQFVISIHAPQWGATAMYGGGTTTPEFQSTHPSGVRQWGITVIPSTKSISIHAPQWGATHTAAQPFAFHHISIHAPQWGATALKSRLNDDLCISIHAPQWGATIMRVRLCFVKLE